MPQAYSDDLRCKVLEAWEAGAGSLRRLAEQFRVSWGYTKKIRAQQRRTGQKERLRQVRRGRLSRVTEAARESLRLWLREQPDLTEAELRQRLEATGIRVCKSRVGQILRALGLRRKKNRSMPPSATRRRIAGGGKSSSLPSPPFRRRS